MNTTLTREDGDRVNECIDVNVAKNDNATFTLMHHLLRICKDVSHFTLSKRT